MASKNLLIFTVYLCVCTHCVIGDVLKWKAGTYDRFNDPKPDDQDTQIMHSDERIFEFGESGDQVYNDLMLSPEVIHKYEEKSQDILNPAVDEINLLLPEDKTNSEAVPFIKPDLIDITRQRRRLNLFNKNYNRDRRSSSSTGFAITSEERQEKYVDDEDPTIRLDKGASRPSKYPAPETSADEGLDRVSENTVSVSAGNMDVNRNAPRKNNKITKLK